MNLNKENTKRIIGILAVAFLFYCFSQHLSTIFYFLGTCWNIIFPLILGFIIAFIFNIPMSFFEQHLFSKKGKTKKTKRMFAFLLTLFVFLGIIALVIYIVIPELIRTVSSLVVQFPAMADRFSNYLNKNSFLQSTYQTIQNMDLNFNLDKIFSSAASGIQKGLTSILSSTTNMIGATINSITSFCMGLVFAVYVLLQKDKLRVQAKQILYAIFPVKSIDQFLNICTLTQKTFSNFLSGQCLEAMILGSMFFISMNLFRMPYTLLISILIAITALIPVLGSFIGCFIGALLIIMVNPIQAFWFIVLFLILQQIEGNLIYPHVVGSAVGLPSIWVFVAVLLGGKVMGIFGMLLFIPLGSVCYTLFREWIYDRLQKKQISSDKYGSYDPLFEDSIEEQSIKEHLQILQEDSNTSEKESTDISQSDQEK